MKGGTIKVGSRRSRLALAQTEQVINRLKEIHPNLNFVVVPITTTGDRITSARELRNAGKGLFVKEIERALLKRKISMAVHSMKDMPSVLPEGLTIGCVPEREDASDLFIGRHGTPLDQLRPEAQVGTSSLRRQALLKALFPQLAPVEMRGNLDTRLEKLRHPKGKLAGIIVSAAGLGRLYPDNGLFIQRFSKEAMVPAAGQGALAIEIREKDQALRELLQPLHHARTAACIAAERNLMRRLEGGCQIPLGIHATHSDDGLITLTGCLSSLDGRRVIRERQVGMADDPDGVAEALETIMNSRGAQDLLAEFRPKAPRRSVRPHRNGTARAKKKKKKKKPARRPSSRRAKPRRAKPRRAKVRRR